VENRRGSGEIRYTSIEFLSRSGEPLSVIRSGDSFVIRFRYHADKEVAYPSFGFRLYTEMGTLVTETSTWHHALEIPLVPAGNGHIDLELDHLNLLPGRYYFSLWLTGSASPLYDNIEHCAQLDVDLANVYSSGKTLDSRYGIVYFPQRWILDGLRPTSASQTDGASVGSPANGVAR
jgi:Wzt-like putative exopolysaccharide export protein